MKHQNSVPFIANAWCDIPIGADFQALPHMVRSEYLRSVISQFIDDSSAGEAISLSFESLEAIIQLTTAEDGEFRQSKNKSLSLSKRWLASHFGEILRIQDVSFVQNASHNSYKYAKKGLSTVGDGCSLTLSYPVEVSLSPFDLFFLLHL
jgi:hypothetical protein